MALIKNFKRAVNTTSNMIAKGLKRSSKTAPKALDMGFDALDVLVDTANRSIRKGNKYNDVQNTKNFEKYCKWLREGKYTKGQIKSWFASDKAGWKKFKEYKETWELKNPLPQPQSQPKATS